MRQILHPGPVASERMKAVEGCPVPLRFSLRPGLSIDKAIAEGFEAAGCKGGFVTLRGGLFEPFKYVIPAASPDAEHVAWYSETYAPEGEVEVTHACAIVGFREGKQFIHCHGLWNTDKGLRMGHMLAPDTTAAHPVVVQGIGMKAATFEALPDAETNFTLFEPVQRSGSDATGEGRALLAKVRPNQDISLAIEEMCAKHGIQAANIFGIGSLNKVQFVDGTHVELHATEVWIRNGTVAPVDGRLQASLHIDVVDMNGDIFSGHLVRGENPVCVTFELVIEDISRR
jgi:predicted DNA-binding protein with PD1-like motif